MGGSSPVGLPHQRRGYGSETVDRRGNPRRNWRQDAAPVKITYSLNTVIIEMSQVPSSSNIVVLQLNCAAFRDELCGIRDGLHELGVTPLQYDYSADAIDGVVNVRLEFSTLNEAHACCARFHGQLYCEV